jgi:hypothetical protein
MPPLLFKIVHRNKSQPYRLNKREVVMPVAIALIVGVVVLATAVIGFVWAIIILLPFYGYVAIAVILVWRSNRRHAERNAQLAALIERETDRQRQFNEQEMRAWRAPLEVQDRNASKRERVLRRFDSTREPPEK